MIELVKIKTEEESQKTASMTLLENMSDFQTPPLISDHPIKKVDLDTCSRLKKRIDKYRQRHNETILSGENGIKAKFELSNEQTKLYYEKWQQQKAKKSSKRQRDPNSNQANQLKRKLSNSKNEGPVNKQQILEKVEEDDDNDAEDFKELLGEINFPENFSENNFNDIMTMLEESESSNASLQDCQDKDIKPNLGYTSPNQHMNQKRTQNQQSQQPHVNNSVTSQIQNSISVQSLPNQMQVVYNSQVPAVPPMAGRQQVYSSSYNNEAFISSSYHDSVAGPVHMPQQHSLQTQHQIGMPNADYSRQSSYNTSYPKGSMHVPSSIVPHISIQPEYNRQMSAPPLQPSMPSSVPFYPQHSQVLPNRTRTEYAIVHPSTTYSNYHPQSAPYPQHTQHVNPEEMQQLEQMRLLKYSRTNSLPSGHTYMDPRVPQTNQYYPSLKQEHQSNPAVYSANQMIPKHSGVIMNQPSYAQPRPNYPVLQSQHVGQPIAGSSSINMMPRHVTPQHNPMSHERPSVPSQLPLMQQVSLPGSGISRQHNTSLPPAHSSQMNQLPYPALPNHLNVMRQNSLPPSNASTMMASGGQMPHQMSQQAASHLAQNQIGGSHPPMHQIPMHCPQSEGSHSHQQVLPQSSSPQPPTAQHLHTNFLMQQQQFQQQQQSRPIQTQQMLPQVPQHIAMQQQQQLQHMSSTHQVQIQNQNHAVSRESQGSVMQEQTTQQQINSFMASSADDLNDLELILSGSQ